MSQKITRRQMKRNELAETVGRTVGYVSQHRRGVSEAAAVGIAAAVLVGGFVLYRTWTDRAAGKALSDALSALETPLASEQPGGGSKFSTAMQRSAVAEPLLKKAAAHGATPPGRAAQVILAASGAEKPETAVRLLEKAARGGQSETAAAAEIDAAKLLSAQGKSAEAIDRIKRAIESPRSAAPKDALLFTLAQIYEQSGSAADARATYQRLINDYPNSPYRADARQKVPFS